MASRTLIPHGKVLISGSEDGLGAYQGVRLSWSCQFDEIYSVPVVTTFKNFHSGEAIIFEMKWPEGAPNTTMSSPNDAMTNFPTLFVSKDTLPSAISWQGSFVQSVDGYSTGTTGGPTVFYNSFDPLLSIVIVGSAWGGNWKTFTAGSNTDYKDKPAAWSPGTSGRISSLPKHYKQSIVLYQAKHGGITEALAGWGKTIQQSRSSGGRKISDVTLQKVGYQTDNGAMYCFCPDQNCSKTLIDEIESLRNSRIPMGYLSFQGAGASSGRGNAAPWCVDTWGVDGGLGLQYPVNLQTFQQALGIPLQLYAPYFCPTSSYFSNHTNWTSVSSDPSLPSCSGFDFQNVKPSQSRQFYGWFFDKGLEVGMSSFEPDFMNQNFNCVPDFIKSTTGVETWQHGMTEAAEARNVSIQWCYATPSDVLAAVDMPAVTNFRVSFDFCYGESWKIGESSLLVWALGFAPSKDTLWTTDNGRTTIPGCPWTPDHETPAAELHLVLALMSTGPVGISDAIGMTNTTLLRRAVTSDGSLLKPSKAITSVDSSFVHSSFGGRRDKEGYLYGSAGLWRSWYFVSFKMRERSTVTARDFWPRIITPAAVLSNKLPILLVYRNFADGVLCRNGTDAVFSGCITEMVILDNSDLSRPVFDVPASSFANVSAGSDFSPTVTTVWQSCSESGWFFLGELNKYVSLSPVRFRNVSCTPSGVSAIVKGSIGEVVEVTALSPHGYPLQVQQRAVTIPSGGVIKVWFGNKRAHAQKTLVQ